MLPVENKQTKNPKKHRQEQTERCGAAWKPDRILKATLPTASAMTYL